ncbi:MAG: hypothetical protein ACXIT4_05145 [Erythrobacter sp.]
MDIIKRGTRFAVLTLRHTDHRWRVYPDTNALIACPCDKAVYDARLDRGGK